MLELLDPDKHSQSCHCHGQAPSLQGRRHCKDHYFINTCLFYNSWLASTHKHILHTNLTIFSAQLRNSLEHHLWVTSCDRLSEISRKRGESVMEISSLPRAGCCQVNICIFSSLRCLRKASWMGDKPQESQHIQAFSWFWAAGGRELFAAKE